MQNQTPPHRIKSWYDGSAASGKWEYQFQKKTLSGETIHKSSQAEISKNVAKDVLTDLEKILKDKKKDLRDREDDLRDLANGLRETIACSELMLNTSALVIEALQSQLDIVKSELLKLSLSRILGTQNCVKKIFETKQEIKSKSLKLPIVRVRVNVGDDTEPHWRHGRVTETFKDSEKLGVRSVRALGSHFYLMRSISLVILPLKCYEILLNRYVSWNGNTRKKDTVKRYLKRYLSRDGNTSKKYLKKRL